MLVKFLDLKNQYELIKGEIDEAISDCINKSDFVGGTSVRNFEEQFARYQQSEYCISCANGTDALEIAIEALDIPKNSEIIVPANSFISTAEAVTRTGNKIIFADIDAETYNISLDHVRKLISPSTKAIIAVHLYGNPSNIRELKEISEKHNLFLIEDCAQAHGSEYEGMRVGSFGDLGTFSFYPGKNLGAYGDGGAITTNNNKLEYRCRLIANHGRVEKYNHIIEGRNSRLDALQARILGVKLKHLDKWLKAKRLLAKKYCSLLANRKEITLPKFTDNCLHSFHLFVIQVKDRDSLKSFLHSHGIETGIHYPISLPMLQAYKYLNQAENTKNANNISSQIISLPIGETLTNDQIKYVCEKIHQFLNSKN
ncbi:MAG: DegT/DnrJ/EryC1/StrS family aminotransferase [Chloroflexota bacterium]|nr:DegT/DnrJ/EryC1/StrS family aminotransferase [Chloroflexota bacterium]